MKKHQLADLIESFIDDTAGPWDWDDFISVRLRDPEMEKIRTFCAELPTRFPPERPRQYCSDAGAQLLRQLVMSLRNDSDERTP